MELKYKQVDTEKMIDVFSNISNNVDNTDIVVNEMRKLLDYPINVIQKFLECIEMLSNKDEDFLKENYLGVVAYITMRLNLV